MKYQHPFSIAIFFSIMSILFAFSANAQDFITRTCCWSAPTEGSPVDHYMVEITKNGFLFLTFDVADTCFTYDWTCGDTFKVRVAGVSESGVPGPFSIWSLPYTPDCEQDSGDLEGTFRINNGDPMTETRDVLLYSNITSALEMRFSNDGVTWPQNWTPYASEYHWRLESSLGDVTVHAQYRDDASHYLSMTDTIYLDEGPPGKPGKPIAD